MSKLSKMLKPWTLRELNRKFKKLKIRSPSSCDIKGKYILGQSCTQGYGFGLVSGTGLWYAWGCIGLGWRNVHCRCTRCWKYPGLSYGMFGGGTMWERPKKGVKLDDSGLRSLLLEWGFMLELVVGNGLTWAVVLVIVIDVLGAWRMLPVPWFSCDCLFERDLQGRSLSVLISTHSRKGQIAS